MSQLVVIVGATGTGKSELSLELATAIADAGGAAEIVSADAMQLYRGMDVGTAKVGVGERRGIPHHMLDVLDPTQEASVADYQADTRAVIENIETRGATPILVGGSGLYVSSVIQDFRFPGTDAVIRARLESELLAQGSRMLHSRLRSVDADAAAAIGPHNGRRLVRALEVIEMTGEPFGSGLPEESLPWREAVIIGLQAPREQLVRRLDARVNSMWTGGILEEAAALTESGLGVTASRAIGYAQAFAQLAGSLAQSAAIEQTAALTRRYARRQVGWFRRYRGAQWLEYDDPGRHATAFERAVGQY
ncbi:tRNA (adenosine(37)-N6)-dimethylallyltransferase MiaA [Salinibacterium sp.]|uniref:tRNA (adenosine(37)-N6)-dimethylallyltransferase MiaA n=1 Tax=Salinibacterium sp. TaxID=1915057 RepID=UPI00286C8596|nr:tRNA (adenosine(37)-N6)-dimethylallyltransferase MiaA [Salinibacterium sp.]